VGSAAKQGLDADYFAALVGPDDPGLEKDVAGWLSAASGTLASFAITGDSSKRDHGQLPPLAALWSKVKAKEKADGRRYRQVFLVRADAYWLDDPVQLWSLNASQAYFRACADDGTAAVVYVLPRSEADEFVGSYAGFLSSNVTAVRPDTNATFNVPAEMFLLEQADKQGLALEGLEGHQLPALPAGRRSASGFEEACAEPCYTEGCDAPASLPLCAAPASALMMSGKAPCLDGSNKCYSAKQRLAPADALRLYQLGHMVDVLLSRHGVWHFAAGGTILGAVRNKGIIPHDDDVDYNILRSPGSYVVKSEAFKADLKKNGLYLAPVHIDFWKVKDPMALCAVDLFAQVYVSGSLTYAMNMWPGPSWPPSITQAGGLVRWPFGSTTVPAPPRDVTLAYLDKKFGPSWDEEVSCKGGYHQCSAVMDTHYDLTGRAMPDTPLETPV
jgi:hypothetical protein